MQFQYILALLVAASTVVAIPTGHMFMRRGCDIKKCMVALASTGVSCASAAAAGGANPFADAGCLASATNAVVNMNAACTSCLEEYHIPEKVKSAEQRVENEAVVVENKVKGVAHKVGDKLRHVF